ncbi:NAD-dependent epimerase/dehydratase family protein [Streptomyces formicae]|uniref:NAD-dependent epimerase/dehydratase family protein n=1 Tax=Streptomyces formicae TaxID=1616117 RepID=UPI001F5804E7|nr:NAD-dependent epimerase/dehydratase family protein [Streptomyces formicae]
MRIVITGGAGFIGSNLARTLAEHPEITQIRVIDNLSTGYKDNLVGLDVHFIEGDIQDAALLDQVFHGADAVVHLAALPSVPRSVKDPVASHHANATGTLQVLEAARRADNLHVIAASSSSVYGSNQLLPKHEDLATAPMSPYAVTKLATEAYLGAYHHSYGLPVLPFRFFNVYGPGQRADHPYAAVIPKWISATLAGRPVIVHGDGTQTRDFTYVGRMPRPHRRAAAPGSRVPPGEPGLRDTSVASGPDSCDRGHNRNPRSEGAHGHSRGRCPPFPGRCHTPTSAIPGGEACTDAGGNLSNDRLAWHLDRGSPVVRMSNRDLWSPFPEHRPGGCRRRPPE